MSDAKPANCPHHGETMFIVSGIRTCAFCEERMPTLLLPAPAPVKPPRRMLQPTKDQLRETIKVLEGQVDELRKGMEITNREAEAAREAYQRLWAATRTKRPETWRQRLLRILPKGSGYGLWQ